MEGGTVRWGGRGSTSRGRLNLKSEQQHLWQALAPGRVSLWLCTSISSGDGGQVQFHNQVAREARVKEEGRKT